MLRCRIRVLAREISAYYQDKPLTLVSLLHGALFFLADLSRELTLDPHIECWEISSYEGKESCGSLSGLEHYQNDFQGRHVLIVDDILDTGLTLNETVKHLHRLGAYDVRTCVLLAKKIERRYPIVPDWLGFEIPNQFVVGYGLDFDGSYRTLPMIRALD